MAVLNKCPSPPRVGIAVLNDSLLGGGGAERRFARLIGHLNTMRGSKSVFLVINDNLTRSLHESSIFIDESCIIPFQHDVSNPYHNNAILRIFNQLYFAAKNSLALIRTCRAYSLNVLHLINYPYYYFPLILFKPRKIAIVMSVVTYTPMYEKATIRDTLFRWLWHQRLDVIDPLYLRFSNRFPKFAAKTLPTPCSFTDYNRYAPAFKKNRWIVFSGRLEARKNPQLFLECLCMMADEMRKSGWKGYILGAGELFYSLSDFIKEKEMKDIVEILTLNDTSTIVNKASIFVSLQNDENYPSQSLLEAMAAGNAVIVTDVGETRRIIQLETGVLISGELKQSLMQALLRLMNDSEMRTRMGRKARDFVIENHRIDRAADHLEFVWQHALKRRRICVSK